MPTSFAKAPISERLLILNALEVAADSTRLNVTLFGLFLGSAGAPLDASTIYMRVRKGELPPPDACLGKKATGWTLGVARKARVEMAERASAMQLPQKQSALARSLNAASVKSLRARQAKQTAKTRQHAGA